MNNFKRFTIGLSAAVCMGTACAQSTIPSESRFDGRFAVSQSRMAKRNRMNGMMLAEQRAPQRRFLMPTKSSAVYSRDINSYRTGVDSMDSRNSRMSADERRALRRQINEANRGIYMRRRNNSSPGL